jgi:hypothetical protein
MSVARSVAEVLRDHVFARGRGDRPDVFLCSAGACHDGGANNGAKSWIIEYRPGGGAQAVGKRRLKLGDVGELTPDEAPQTARTAMSRVRLGVIVPPHGAKQAAP